MHHGICYWKGYVHYVSRLDVVLLFSLVASDPDSGENAVVLYGVFPQDVFVARSATGDIFTAQNTQLDFETRNSYQVEVSEISFLGMLSLNRSPIM